MEDRRVTRALAFPLATAQDPWLGPRFAFVVASSALSLLNLGPLFRALVISTGISLLLEGDALRQLRCLPQAPGEQHPARSDRR